MDSWNVGLLAYMAPQPSLPVTSTLAIIVGVALMFGRGLLGPVVRRLRRDGNRSTRGDRPKLPRSSAARQVRELAGPSR